MAILADELDLRNTFARSYEISLFAALVYCFYLVFCISPFTRNKFDVTRLIEIKKTNLVKFLAIIVFLWFILTLYAQKDDIVTTLLMSNLGQVRNEGYLYGPQASYMASLPGGIKQLVALLNFSFSCPWIMMFMGYYCLVYGKDLIKYSPCFFVASLSGPISGILTADRSSSAYWIIALVSLFFFYKPLLSSEARKKMYLFGGGIIGIVCTYLISVTVSRFGEITGTSDGANEGLGSIINYIGQSYVDFCYFFDNYKPPFIHLGIIFPITSQYIFNVPSGGVAIQEMMASATHFETGVFYTFLGHITMGAGSFVTFIYVLVYRGISSLFFKQRNKKNVSLLQLYIYYALISVVLLGLFTHYYASTGTLALVVWFFIIKYIIK